MLELTQARGELTSTLTGHGDWAVRFPAPAGAKFNAVVSGSCVLDTAGLDRPIPLAAGDAFLLTREQEFVLATSLRSAEQPARVLFDRAAGRGATAGDPQAPVTAQLIGGSFTFDRRARELLLDALPPVVHVPADAEGAAGIRQLLERVAQEADRAAPGSGAVGAHLAIVLLIDIVRHHLAQRGGAAGWLRGLADPVAGPALRAIHAYPAARWTVQLLADEARVSRSTMAARFAAVVGTGPLTYLTRWRIELATHRLTTTDQTIALISQAVGYGSEAAFALAFKRERGLPPGAFRRSRRVAGAGA